MTKKIVPIKSPLIIAVIATATTVFTHAPAAVDKTDPLPLTLAQAAVRAVTQTICFTPRQCERLGGVAAAALAATSATLQVAGLKDTTTAQNKLFGGFNIGINHCQYRDDNLTEKQQDDRMIDEVIRSCAGGWFAHALGHGDEKTKDSLRRRIQTYISDAQSFAAQRSA